MMLRQRRWLAAIPLAALLAEGWAGQALAAFDLVVAGGRLTAWAEAEPLRNVLAELARATGASIVGLTKDDDRLVSFAVADIPLAEGLERILQEGRFLLIFARAGSDDHLVRIALVSSARAGEVSMPPPQPSEEAETAFDNRDSRSRAEATARLAQQAETAEVESRLETTLGTDPDVDVRRAALHGLIARGVLDVDAVLQTACMDADADLRAEAVRALRLFASEDPNVARVVAVLAETEDDAEVQEVARTLVAELAR